MWRWFSGTAPRLNTNKVPEEQQTGPGDWGAQGAGQECGLAGRTNLGWFQPNLEQKNNKTAGSYRGRRCWRCGCCFCCYCCCCCRWRWRWVAGNHLPRPASNYLFLCCLSAASWGKAVWSCRHRLLVQAMRHPLKHKSKQEAWPSMSASEHGCFSKMRALLASRSHALQAVRMIYSFRKGTHTRTQRETAIQETQLDSDSTPQGSCSGSAQTWIERGALKFASCALGNRLNCWTNCYLPTLLVVQRDLPVPNCVGSVNQRRRQNIITQNSSSLMEYLVLTQTT